MKINTSNATRGTNRTCCLWVMFFFPRLALASSHSRRFKVGIWGSHQIFVFWATPGERKLPSLRANYVWMYSRTSTGLLLTAYLELAIISLLLNLLDAIFSSTSRVLEQKCSFWTLEHLLFCGILIPPIKTFCGIERPSSSSSTSARR